MKYIKIGQIVKPQGIKGELKIRVLANNNYKFLESKVYVDQKEYNVVDFRQIDQGFAIIKLKELNTRLDAENLRNKFVEICLESITDNLMDSEYIIDDLIGLTCVFENGTAVGVLQDIQNFGSADVFYVTKSNGKQILFARVKGVIKLVDKENKQIILDEKIFSEVCV